MNKLFRWIEEVVAPNTAAARRKAEEYLATGGSILKPVLWAQPAYDNDLDIWTIETSQELAVGDEVSLVRWKTEKSISSIMIRAEIASVITTLNENGNFVYGINIFSKEPINDRDTDSQGPPL